MIRSLLSSDGLDPNPKLQSDASFGRLHLAGGPFKYHAHRVDSYLTARSSFSVADSVHVVDTRLAQEREPASQLA
jgi:hypothetical protein